MSTPHAAVSPTRSRVGSYTLTRARALTTEIRGHLQRRRSDLAAVAHKLREIRDGELHRAMGYTSIYTYAWREHAFGKTKVKDLIGISRKSSSLPMIREAFDQGGLDWTKAREITKVATPADEADWLRRAETSTGEELRDQARGRSPRIRRTLTFSPDQAARFDQLVAGVRGERRGASDAEAVLMLLERGASGERGRAPIRHTAASLARQHDLAAGVTPPLDLSADSTPPLDPAAGVAAATATTGPVAAATPPPAGATPPPEPVAGTPATAGPELEEVTKQALESLGLKPGEANLRLIRVLQQGGTWTVESLLVAAPRAA